MNTNVAVPTRTIDSMLKYVELSSALTKRALDEVGIYDQGRQKAAQLATPLIKHMLDKRVILAGQEKEAEAMLGAHDTTLSLLKGATDKIAELNAEIASLKGAAGIELGRVEPGTKTASDAMDSLTNPIVGGYSGGRKASDAPLLALIGR